jgi:[acyl-carrier-protein] S-malonyltransferase
MNAFLFPGQGSQQVGMGADLFQSDPAFCRLIDQASESAGIDLRNICLRGPDRELVKTQNLQPLLVAVSLGYHRHLIATGIRPAVVLGHSLGEISALNAAGVLTPEDAVRVAARRGAFMGSVAAQLNGGMLAVLSTNRPRILEVLSGLLQAGRVFLANDNAPGQLLLSGLADGLAGAADAIADAKLGACKRLPVAGPWHSPLMLPAQRQFSAWLQEIPFSQPTVPVLMNASAALEQSAQSIRHLVIRNLTEPVQWRACMERLAQMWPRILYEIGPGRVLSGLARANGLGNEVQIRNVNRLECGAARNDALERL